MSDRPVWVLGSGVRLKLRRLMYQSLIWALDLGDEAGGLTTAGNTKRLERLADTLVDGVRGDFESDRNLLGREMLIDKTEAFELTWGQPPDAFDHVETGPAYSARPHGSVHPSSFHACETPERTPGFKVTYVNSV